MDKQSITITSYKNKFKQADGTPYSVYETNRGRMTAFNKELNDKLQLHKNMPVIVHTELSPDGKWTNIREFIMVDPDNLPEQPKVDEIQMKEEKPAYDGNGSMYASYAKDILIALINKVDDVTENMDTTKIAMGEAIKLVKQAREAFR